jgi:hypothetical protein
MFPVKDGHFGSEVSCIASSDPRGLAENKKQRKAKRGTFMEEASVGGWCESSPAKIISAGEGLTSSSLEASQLFRRPGLLVFRGGYGLPGRRKTESGRAGKDHDSFALQAHPDIFVS